MKPRTFIVYHDEDLDGHCSAAIAIQALRVRNIVLCPAAYDEPDPLLEHKIESRDSVLFLDWSVSEEQLRALRVDGLECYVTIIDHHLTSFRTREACRDLLAGVEWVLDAERAACELAWHHYNPTLPTPLAVYLLGRWDVWDHSDRLCEPFQMGARSVPLDPKTCMSSWIALLAGNTVMVEELLTVGFGLVRYEKDMLLEAAKRGTLSNLSLIEGQPDVPLLVVNHFRAPKLRDLLDVPAVCAFTRSGDKWRVSLYVTGDVDASKICGLYGGGGHAGAAGFVCDELPNWVLGTCSG